MKKTVIALALVLTAACASTPMNSSSTDATSGARAGVATSTNNAPNYILFSEPNTVRTVDFSKAIYGLNLKGTLTNRGFYPASKTIEGRGNFCADGKDWMSLTDLTIHKAADGKTPTGSYVLGCASGNAFTPASRDAVVIQ